MRSVKISFGLVGYRQLQANRMTPKHSDFNLIVMFIFVLFKDLAVTK